MSIGPVEYLIVTFPGNQFNGDVAPELGKLIDSGTVRLIDLVFITKDSDGNVAAVEVDEHHAVASFTEIDGEIGGVIGDDDIAYAAAGLEPNSSAALLVWEDLWAKPFVDALRASGAELIEGSRIPRELIEPVAEQLGVG